MASISVVIATHDRLPFIRQSVESILCQAPADLEIIIVDDASSDGTEAFLRGHFGDRLIYRRHQERLGPSEARNTGIAASKGDFISFQDSDDEAYPTRFASQERALSEDPALVIVGGQIDYYDLALKEIISRPQILAYSDFEIRFNSLFLQPISFGACMVRGETVRRHSISLNPNCPGAEDYDFVLRVLALGRARNLAEPVLKYRCHDKQHSRLMRPLMREIHENLSNERLASIGVKIDADTRSTLEKILSFPNATFLDLKTGKYDSNILWLFNNSYKILLEIADVLAAVEPPLAGELDALKARLQQRLLTANSLRA